MAQAGVVTNDQFYSLEHRVEKMELMLKGLVSAFKKKETVHKLSDESEKRYFIELAEFLKQQERNPTPGARSVKELMKQLDQL